ALGAAGRGFSVGDERGGGPLRLGGEDHPRVEALGLELPAQALQLLLRLRARPLARDPCPPLHGPRPPPQPAPPPAPPAAPPCAAGCASARCRSAPASAPPRRAAAPPPPPAPPPGWPRSPRSRRRGSRWRSGCGRC